MVRGRTTTGASKLRGAVVGATTPEGPRGVDRGPAVTEVVGRATAVPTPTTTSKQATRRRWRDLRSCLPIRGRRFAAPITASEEDRGPCISSPQGGRAPPTARKEIARPCKSNAGRSGLPVFITSPYHGRSGECGGEPIRIVKVQSSLGVNVARGVGERLPTRRLAGAKVGEGMSDTPAIRPARGDGWAQLILC